MRPASLTDPTATLGDVLRGRRLGCSLPRALYLRDDVYVADMELLTGRWIYAAHVSELAESGNWITAELGPESAIVVRGEDGEIRAFANVCRHRGSRICNEPAGHATLLVCPYHAWSYRLDGSLRAAREMGPDFDPAAHGLARLPLAQIGGLIFVAFGPDPPSLESAAPSLAAMFDLFAWRSARVAMRRSYRVAANWKLAMENYQECYHCAPAHPEFALAHALARPNARALSYEPDAASGLSDYEAWGPEPDRSEVARVMRSHLSERYATGSRDGARLAPPMGEGGRRDDGLCVFAELGFLSAFLAYPDHGLIYRFLPRAPLVTEMEVIWLVDGAARAGCDYDEEELAWLWDVTTRADKQIIERNQAGVASRFYQPGPFSLMEPGAAQYVERYAGELSLLVGGA
ncbi:MAG TPA: aromatic ring-hydroxylating dioxygenase subunit alpha [Caulobacteraceae bacterium]|jgi:Rieske 2Fe-2S family protein|nr:aromatic ring-hydroxylating dioxygenase subunit alpha [Caulobacteraceae bacterium]